MSTQHFKPHTPIDPAPMIVGLTGGIGSGKTAVSDLLSAEYNIEVVDADIVARQVVEPGTQALAQIAAHFGNHVIQQDGSLDRAALRQCVFKDGNKRKWLEALLHPLIRSDIVNQLKAPSKHPYRLLASPLLLETDQHTLVDCILVVDVDKAHQLDRTCARDDNSREQVEAIINAQISASGRRARADLLIDNRGSKSALVEQVRQTHQNLCALARTFHNDKTRS